MAEYNDVTKNYGSLSSEILNCNDYNGVVVNGQFIILELLGSTEEYVQSLPEETNLNILKTARYGLEKYIEKLIAYAKSANKPCSLDIAISDIKKLSGLRVIPLKLVQQDFFIILFKENFNNNFENKSQDISALQTKSAKNYPEKQHIIEQDAEAIKNLTGNIEKLKRMPAESEILKKVEEAELRLRLAIESGQLGTFELKINENEIIYSERLAEIFGFSTEEKIVHDDLKKVVHPHDLHLRNEAHALAMKTGNLLYEARLVWKDGSVHWIRTSGKVFYENKIPYKLYGTVLDITEEKSTRLVLEESEDRLRTLANSIPQLAWIAEPNGYIYWYNQRWYDYTGTTLDEMKGGGWHSVHHPDSVDEVVAKFENALAEGKDYEQIFLLRSKEGDYRWFLTRAIPIKNEEGKILQWLGTNTDVTEQQNLGESLKQSEAKFRLLADSMPQLIWTGDAEGNLNYFNEAVFQYSGLTLNELEKDGWLKIVHPHERGANIAKWMNAVKTGNDFFIEHRFKNKAGEYRWQLSRAKPKRNNEGKIRMWVGTSTDINDQKIKEEKKDEFLSIASHEMKTPLTTAKAYLQLLESSIDKDNETANLYAKKASNSVKRISELISELLDVSKIQSGKLDYNISTFNFDKFITETVEDLQHISPQHRIIKTGILHKHISGDKERLQQVVINLISNAIKYSPGSEEVYVTLEEKAGEIKVAVKDSGIGLSKANVERIFERYFRVEEHAVQFQGLGIGLYISYEIIMRHNGKLWAESEPGKGSTFYFTLPLQN